MRPGSCESALEARNCDEYRSAIVEFTHDLGFNTVSAMTVVDRLAGPPEFLTVDNTPSAYLEIYTQVAIQRRDPVMQHCKTRSSPIIWDRSTYVKAGHEDIWEVQASYGYRTGIAVALHMPGGLHFLLGLDRDQALPKDPPTLRRLVADLHLFAAYAQEGAARILLPPEPERDAGLTPRELEALRWTLDGKTAWELGRLFSVSERTAVFHLNGAMHKLGCVTKHQAALKAQRMGLLR